MSDTQPSVFQEAPWTPQLSQMPEAERPQERLEKLGPRALADAELLAMILRFGTKGEDVLKVATHLVHDAGSLANLVAWSPEDFAERRGIGKVKALQLMTVFEIARRVIEQRKPADMGTPGAVSEYFRDVVLGLDVEKCWVLCLNSRNHLQRCIEITSGTSNSTLVTPQGVFRPALRLAATAVIVVHNHPSGDPEPSRADFAATRRLKEAGEILNIELRDHIVLGTPAADKVGQGWFSFRAAGVL
ncbi:MAG: DNA repair protein RadC [Puniceicoccales bacterium]|jgi:DNA repair protein RadC|nr:DNA repair protein RadC [Puniceicoccales bacterium]